MSDQTKFINFLVALLATAMLQGCGGGSTDSPSNPPFAPAESVTKSAYYRYATPPSGFTAGVGWMQAIDINGKGIASKVEVDFLSESVFISDFPSALATFLHEHAHIFGHDGSRAFTDALTELMETIVRQRDDLDRYDIQWKSAMATVQRERVEAELNGTVDSLNAWILKMDEHELRELVGRVPPVVLNQMRSKRVVK